MFGADLFLTPFMELQVRTVTKLSGIKKIWKIYLLDFSNRVFLPLTRGGLISVGSAGDPYPEVAPRGLH